MIIERSVNGSKSTPSEQLLAFNSLNIVALGIKKLASPSPASVLKKGGLQIDQSFTATKDNRSFRNKKTIRFAHWL